jgi:anti-sigma regulatory factor (Ser/Thr protein kinase)
MVRKSRDNPEIHRFILRNVAAHPGDIASLTAKKFEISRVTSNRYLDKLVDTGQLEASGVTRARRYVLKRLDEDHFELKVEGLEEHIVWRNHLAQRLGGMPQNVLEICEYGVNEMINNVIDHSGSEMCNVHFYRTAAEIQIIVRDFGIGVFKKIADDCHLADQREAIFELAKGKLTTDPAKHTGQGIFFTSRMFTEFALHAGHLLLHHERDKDQDDEDWLVEVEKNLRIGTVVRLAIDPSVTYRMQDVFSQFEKDEDGVRGFVRTRVPIHLALYGNEQLVSRSQARRVLARFNRFSEVMLDFKGVPSIGQAFADEVFRVFKSTHPEISIIPARASPEVMAMIESVTKPVADLPLFVDRPPSAASGGGA